jgi:hypothetical protein
MVLEDAGAVPLCAAYTQCVYVTFLQNLASSDAGTQGEPQDLMEAQAACAANFISSSSMSSFAMGNALIGCIASNCVTPCVVQQ